MTATEIILSQQEQIDKLHEMCNDWADMIERYKAIVKDQQAEILRLEEKRFVRNEN
jgi:uncharacterized protein (DUF305 family)